MGQEVVIGGQEAGAEQWWGSRWQWEAGSGGEQAAVDERTREQKGTDQEKETPG